MIEPSVVYRYQSTAPNTNFVMTNFKVFEEGDIKVVKTSASGVDSVLTLTTDYSVTLQSPGQQDTTVILNVALTAGEKLTVIRDIDFTQPTDYVENGTYDPEVHEKSLDRLTLIQQQLKEMLERAPSAPISNTFTDFQLPAPVALQYLQWNSSADGLQNGSPPNGISDVEEDTFPTLGGNLNVATYNLISSSGNNITLNPDGAGTIELVGNTNVTGDLSMTGDFGPGSVTLSGGITLQGDLNVNGNSIVSSSNGDINITPNGSGQVILDGLSWPSSDGSNQHVLQTDGAGNLSFSAVGGGLTNEGAHEFLYEYSLGTFQAFDDFTALVENSAGSERYPFPWDLDTSGGTLTQLPSTNTEIGVLDMTLTTGSSDYVGITTPETQVSLGGGEITVEWRVHVETLLSSSVDEGIYYIGLSNLVDASGTPANGVYFKYSDSSANWRAVTISSSSETDTDTSIPVGTAAHVKLRMVINAAGTSVGFYIDDSLVATNVTNIPSTGLAPIASFQRRSIAGTNTLEMALDWFYLKWALTTTR